ncbi:MAG: hypothetical protein SFU98_21840 [Leptospiraceae bacterium]|nr:hypothetical protein [Leptospiraceae bacterium]
MNEILGREIDGRYETILQEAEFYFQNDKLNISKQKLEKLDREYEQKDFRYYAIKGKLLDKEERYLDATENYVSSIKLKQDQKDVAKRLYEIYREDRKWNLAFDYLRIYLSLEENPELRFDSIVISSRLGNHKYYNYAIAKAESKKSKSEEEIIKSSTTNFKKSKYSECIEEIKKEIIYKPRSKKLHNQIIRCSLKKGNSEESEKYLLDRAAIFFDEEKFSLELARFYEENHQGQYSLNLLRRALYQSFQKDKPNLEEILYLIRNAYITLGRNKDANSISDLISNIKLKEFDSDNLISLYKVLNNREVLEVLIYGLKKQGKNDMAKSYEEELMRRDESSEEKEFMKIFPVFIQERK